MQPFGFGPFTLCAFQIGRNGEPCGRRDAKGIRTRERDIRNLCLAYQPQGPEGIGVVGMLFHSTATPSLKVSAREAVLQGLAQDKGLFMPESIPRLPAEVLSRLHEFSLREIAWEVSRLFFADAVPEDELRGIIERAMNFSAPVVPVCENVYSLELFHGPTLAFKDFGARFMAQLTAISTMQAPAGFSCL